MKLYELIQSMTKPEKRHFKSYTKSGIGEQPRYIVLFDVLCKAESSVDMEEVAKKRFSYDDRNLLFEKLLGALHIFHSQKSIDAEIQLLISQAVILREKNIWDEVDRRLQKAKKLALKNERLIFLLQIIQLQKDMASMRGDVPVAKALAEERLTVSKQFMEEINYEHQRDLSMLTRTSLDLTKAEKLKKLKKLTNPPQLPDLQPSSTAFSKLNYHDAKFIYELSAVNEEQLAFYAKKILNIYKECDFVFSNKHHNITSLYFYVLFYLRKNNAEKLDIDDIINNLPVKSDSMIYAVYSYFLLNCVISNPDEVQGEAIIHKMTVERDINRIYIHRQIFCIYLITVFYGNFGHWKKADIWFKRLCAIKRPKIFRYIQIKIRIYSLIINYELDEDADIHIQSVKKYLKRNKLYSDIEKNILEAFNQLDQTYLHRDKIKIWTKLLHLLDDVLAKKLHIASVELKRWCTSKIEGITIAEVIRREQQNIKG